MILVHETSFNILIHFTSKKRFNIILNIILYRNYKIPYTHMQHIIFYYISQCDIEK